MRLHLLAVDPCEGLDSATTTLIRDNSVDMPAFRYQFWKFLKDESGPTSVEYAVMLALIIAICLVAISALGQNQSDMWDEMVDELSDVKFVK